MQWKHVARYSTGVLLLLALWAIPANGNPDLTLPPLPIFSDWMLAMPQIVGIQQVPVLDFNGYPDSSINNPSTGKGRVYFSTTTNQLTCITSTGASCMAGGGGGSGTVTSVSAGNLSPLFTTSVATPTTTPALSFALVSQLQNLVYASPNGSSGNPGFRALVTADLPAGPAGCPAGSANALQKTNGTTCAASSVTDNGTTVASPTESVTVGPVGNKHALISATDGSYTTFQADGVTPAIPSISGGIGTSALPGSGREGFGWNTDNLPHAGIGGIDMGTVPIVLVSVSGTNTYVSTSPVGAYQKGQMYCFDPVISNTTTTPTMNVNSLGAITITKAQGSALAPSDLVAAHMSCMEYNATTFDLLNPATGSIPSVSTFMPFPVQGTGSINVGTVGTTFGSGFVSLVNGSYGHIIYGVQVADNTANTYQIGVYNLVTGATVCSSAVSAGTVLFPATGHQTATMTSNCVLTIGGIYGFSSAQVTGTQTAKFAGAGSVAGSGVTPFAIAQLSASVFPGTITPPTLTYVQTTSLNAPWFAFIP